MRGEVRVRARVRSQESGVDGEDEGEVGEGEGKGEVGEGEGEGEVGEGEGEG